MTKMDAYPLPHTDSCPDALNGSEWFSTLDLASGYLQVAMEGASIEKTAFLTHKVFFSGQSCRSGCVMLLQHLNYSWTLY